MKIACCMVRLNHYQIGPDRLDGPNTDRVVASLQGAGENGRLSRHNHCPSMKEVTSNVDEVAVFSEGCGERRPVTGIPCRFLILEERS